MLKLKEVLRSEVTLFILFEENDSLGCNIAGGRDSLVSTLVDGGLDLFKSFVVSNGSAFGGSGSDFLRNRKLHIVVIMAMVAAKLAANNEK
ncbi:hypothetical protein MtrunA17_Chr3g0135881 [Medicago truncatula]|uniref:Uncharacterized protein n=1 Tax=Medicago truncatula TaxID=3880 RepID=A0A396J181_MEDTR|nr:hypothetical protein MtrunA17_Chr3g0135881 [Medicago truncatula]